MNSASPVQNKVVLLEHLRVERRSYIIGTLVIWAAIFVAVLILFLKAAPHAFDAAHAKSLSAVIQQSLHESSAIHLSEGQKALIFALEMLGAVALFFLNWRFSYVLKRPRWAFISTRPGVAFPAARWWWWGILIFVSLYYLGFLVPQLILTAVMAHWGTQEIERLQAAPPPPPPDHDA